MTSYQNLHNNINDLRIIFLPQIRKNYIGSVYNGHVVAFGVYVMCSGLFTIFRNYFPNEQMRRTNFSTSNVLLKLLLILINWALKQSEHSSNCTHHRKSILQNYLQWSNEAKKKTLWHHFNDGNFTMKRSFYQNTKETIFASHEE